MVGRRGDAARRLKPTYGVLVPHPPFQKGHSKEAIMKPNYSFSPLTLAAAAVSLLAGGTAAQAPLVPRRVPTPIYRHHLAAPPTPTQERPILSGTSVISAPILGSAAPRGPLVPRTRLGAVSAPTGSAPAWTFIGPAGVLNAGGAVGGAFQTVSGRVADMAVDPGDPNTFYVASAGGGVWKTTDGGGSYVPLTDYLGDTAMGSIAVAKSQPSVIYAGTGEANNSGDSKYGIGLLKSTDGGATWSVIPGPPDGSGLGAFVRRAISRIVVDPTDALTVYLTVTDFAANGLGDNTGVWKTTDGGSTWTNTTAAAGLTSFEPYSDLVIDPTIDPVAHHPLTLYTAIGDIFGSTANGIYKTTDGGTTWT